MNWTKWSSIAEITSSIAIVLTLIYLAIQTQQNQELLRAQANQMYMSQRVTTIEPLMGDSELATAFFKGQNNQELTPLERHKLNWFYNSILTVWEWEFEQYQSGLHEPALLAWQFVFNTWPDFKSNYNSAAWLSEEFRDYMNLNVVDQ
jgi:hypothetical protein